MCSSVKCEQLIPAFKLSLSSCRVFGVVLIIVDIIVVIVDLAISEKKKGVREILEGVSLAIALFFLIDVLLRVFVEG